MTLTLEVTIERKDREMAAFVVLPASEVAALGVTGTTTVEGTLDDVPIGRRSLLRWDADRWSIELPRPVEAAVGKAPGTLATLHLRIASAELPAELVALLAADAEARGRWEALSPSRQRMIREEVLAAKTTAARARRASKALAPCPPAKVPAPVGLGATPRPVLLRVTGRPLPGLHCGPYTDVHVGMVQRTGCHPEGMVAGDAVEVTWETRMEVRESAGRAAFRGPAVNGPPEERFIYLSWVGRLNGELHGGFRRAKLRLDAVPTDVLVAAAVSGTLLAGLDLRDENGLPICGSVRPPKIRWWAGPS